MLNSEQIKSHIKLSEYSKLTQAGVDLSVFKIEIILKGGIVLRDKTIIDKENYEELPLEERQILGIKETLMANGHLFLAKHSMMQQIHELVFLLHLEALAY